MKDQRQIAKEIAEMLAGLTLGEGIQVLDSVKNYYLGMRIGEKEKKEAPAAKKDVKRS